MNPLYINYFLMLQFAALCGAWLWQGDKMQAIYWFGALTCTAGVTFR